MVRKKTCAKAKVYVNRKKKNPVKLKMLLNCITTIKYWPRPIRRPALFLLRGCTIIYQSLPFTIHCEYHTNLKGSILSYGKLFKTVYKSVDPTSEY